MSELIQELRQGRGGSLSGMTMEDILSQITDLITRKEKLSALKAKVHIQYVLVLKCLF